MIERQLKQISSYVQKTVSPGAECPGLVWHLLKAIWGLNCSVLPLMQGSRALKMALSSRLQDVASAPASNLCFGQKEGERWRTTGQKSPPPAASICPALSYGHLAVREAGNYSAALSKMRVLLVWKRGQGIWCGCLPHFK